MSVITVHLDFHFNLRSVLLDFNISHCSSYNVVFFYLVNNSVDRVPVICKLATKWYLMRMSAS